MFLVNTVEPAPMKVICGHGIASGCDFEGRADQPAGVVGFRVHQHLGDRAFLHDPAVLHHDDPVAERAHDLEVVADEEVAEAPLALEPAQEVDDLRLNREVEGRGRLVEQDELGLERDRPRDGEPLALAAGELVREARGDGVGEARVAQRRLDPLEPVAGVAAPMPLTISPSSISWRTDMRGLSEEKGSWNTICIRERRCCICCAAVVLDVLAEEDDAAAGQLADAASAPCRRWSCPTPTRRRCRASRRA